MEDAKKLSSNNSFMFFCGNGSSYTGDLPASNYAYGIFHAARRTSDYIFVTAYPANPDYPVIRNVYTGSKWEGWLDFSDRSSVSSFKIGNVGVAFRSITGTGEGSSKTAIRLITLPEIDDIFGTTGSSSSNTLVLAGNGDSNASSAHIEGCALDTNVWKATTDRAIDASMRINYMVVRWGL